MVGVDPWVTFDGVCNQTADTIEWFATRTIDEHTTGRLDFVICS